jgi:glutamate synthase (NADPH) small chain
MDQNRLRELEDLCIQECSPWCTTACPVHVDVRSMIKALSSGDFNAAAGVFRRYVPFPTIISRICEHPCQNECKLREAGAEISIRSLENAAMRLSTVAEDHHPKVPAKNNKMAIVGSGLTGLTAAVDLARKGYSPVIIEAGERLGGSLWDYSENDLPPDIILKDLQLLAELNVEVRFNILVGKDLRLVEILEEFDAVCLSACPEPHVKFDLQLNSEGTIKADPVTFGTNRPGIFYAGKDLNRDSGSSPILSISVGRRVAVSMDRFVQKVSLTAGRENEGPYRSRLYTNLHAGKLFSVVEATDPQKGYSAEEAVKEAQRCIQCECMECVKVCEFLAGFRGYPKKYIRQIYNNLSIVMGRRHGNKLINSCSLCGLCKEVCPNDLDMGAVCKEARETMVRDGKMPPSAHEFALRDMGFSNSDEFRLARCEPGADSSAYLFLPGCQLPASSPQNVKKAYSFLRKKLIGGLGLALRCCGAPAEWAGRKEMFQQALQEFQEIWEQMRRPIVIAACSTCYSILKNHLPQVTLTSLWEVLDKIGIPNGVRPPIPSTLAIHDPCTSRHETEIQESARRLLASMGYDIRELPLSRDRTECCGFGGLMAFANRELADQVVKRRLSLSSNNFVTYCAVCRDQFASMGKPSLHLLDLIFGSGPETNPLRGNSFSQRRENRSRLKKDLLWDLWGESVSESENYRHIKLRISPEILALMEKRMILVEDLQQVIDWSERTGSKLRGKVNGHFLGHYRPANVTYWVEYSPTLEGFKIHNAYSHRMMIVEEEQT